MKVGNIVAPNSKGQIVLPKQIRDSLGITSGKPLNIVLRGSGAYIYPVEGVITSIGADNDSILEILKMTQGSWKDDDWEQTEKRRDKIENQAALQSRKAW